jgi:hypothetical protein
MKVTADIPDNNVKITRKGILVYINSDNNKRFARLLVSKGGLRWYPRYAEKGRYKDWGKVKDFFETLRR